MPSSTRSLTSSAPSSPITTASQEPEPQVGGMFNGSRITDIQIEITDRGGMRFKKRFLLTLEGGMMAMDDRYITKAEMLAAENAKDQPISEDSMNSFGSFTFEGMELPESAKGAKALKEQEREERRRKREERKGKPPKHHSSNANSVKSCPSKPPPSPKRNVDKVEKRKRNLSLPRKPASFKDGSSSGSRRRNSSLPRKPASFKSSDGGSVSSKKKVAVVAKMVKVYSSGGGGTTWKFPTDAPKNSDLWEPTDVSLLPGIPEDESVSDIQLTRTTGLWGYVPKEKQEKANFNASMSSFDSSFSSLDDTTIGSTTTSKLNSKDVWVYPPNTQVPSFFPVHGTYKLSKKTMWPPPIDKKKKEQRRVAKLKALPELFAKSQAKPLQIQVTSKKKATDDTSKLKGVWTYLPGQEQKDDEWMAQDVELLPPGQEPSSDDSDLAQGTWVIYDTDDETAEQSSSKHRQSSIGDVLQPNALHNQWIDSKQQPKVHLFAPGQEPKDENVVAKGIWTFSKESSFKKKWPPPTQKEYKRLQQKEKVGKVVIPKIFQHQPKRPMTVYSKACPQWKKPKDKSNSKELEPVSGQWTFFDGQDEDANGNWEPVQVELYAPDEAPTNSTNNLVQGIWTIHDSDPEQVCVHPPSYQLDEKDESILANGIWTFYDEERIGGDDGDAWAPVSWPPPSKEDAERRRKEAAAPKWAPPGLKPGDTWDSHAVTVIPKAALSKKKKQNNTDGANLPILGIWAFNDAPPDESDNWLPQDLVVYPEGKVPSVPKEQPTGVWGIHAGTEPNSEGAFAPEDVWFFTPGDDESLREDFIVQGTWAYPQKKKKIEWPPKTKKIEKKTKKPKLGKLPKWDPNGHGEDWKPTKVSVAPRSKVSDAKPIGVWGFKDGEEPSDLDDWNALDVLVYPKGADVPEPDNKAMGIWGYHKDATPDDNGDWSASDVIFCAPGEKAGKDMTVQGKWTFFDGDQEWPAEPFPLEDRPKWDPNTQGQEWEPQKVSVLPRTKTDSIDGTPTGVWGFKDGQEPEKLDEWKAMEVLVYPKGAEPEKDEVEGRPMGIWGYHKNATPDENGGWAADAIVFCAPGEEAPEDVVAQGTWTFFDNEETWPAESFHARELKTPKKKKKKPISRKPPLNPKPTTPVKQPKPPTAVQHESPQMKAKKPVIEPLLSPLDRAKMRVKPVKSPCKDEEDEEKHVPILGKYQSAFEVANQPSKPKSMRGLLKKKYKK